MKLEESTKQNTNETSLGQTQEAVTVPQSQEELLETKIENIEKIADQVDDFSPAELAEIKNLGGDENELAEELAPVDEEIKRTRSGFIDRAKNYVVSLATMIASVGNMSGANTDQKVKDKAEANVLYVDNKNDLRLKAYQDSSALYNNYIDLKSKLKSQNYEKKKQAFYNSPEEALADKAKHDKEHIDGVNPIPTKVTKKTETLKSVNDFIGGVVNPTLPEQLFSDSIKPSGMEQYDHNDGIGTMQRIFGNVNDKQEFLKNKAYGDTRIIANYSNVKPKVEVKLRQVPEVKTVDKKVLVPEKKPKLSETKLNPKEILDTSSKYNFLDLPKIPIGTLDSTMVRNFQSFNKEKEVISPEDKYEYELFKKSYEQNIKSNDFKGTIYDNESRLQDLERSVQLYQKEHPKMYMVKMSFAEYTDLMKSQGTIDEFADPTYLKPESVLVFLDPQHKKNNQDKLMEASFVYRFPKLYEQKIAESQKLEVKKEIVKPPEKTGYTVRVGEKLFYLSKEDVNKLEADKTTFYNSSEQGNGAEQHLVWRGNEQGQTLQQVAERLGIKLPIAFDTQEQKFENE